MSLQTLLRGIVIVTRALILYVPCNSIDIGRVVSVYTCTMYLVHSLNFYTDLYV